MRIGLISDLHIDINEGLPVIEETAKAAQAQQVDVLVIAGDISETPAQSMAAMRRLQTLCVFPVYYVPGNHDLWYKNCPGMSTETIYAHFREEMGCLSGKNRVLQKESSKIALMGDVGWYDYSLAADGISEEELASMSRNGRTWQDHLFNDWTADNCGQMARSLEALEAQLKKCGDLPVMAVTHMLPIADFCVPCDQGDWPFFNAYLGSTAIDALYRRYKVKYAVCGHVHYRKKMEREGITYICPCLGYHTEWPLYELTDCDTATHVRHALQIVIVEDD